jgi:hypothetical protein
MRLFLFLRFAVTAIRWVEELAVGTETVDVGLGYRVGPIIRA